VAEGSIVIAAAEPDICCDLKVSYGSCFVDGRGYRICDGPMMRRIPPFNASGVGFPAEPRAASGAVPTGRQGGRRVPR